MEDLGLSAEAEAEREAGMQDGGVLYTWGGVGGACVSDAPQQQPARKEDSNKGCLGLGDTTGRKLPTR